MDERGGAERVVRPLASKVVARTPDRTRRRRFVRPHRPGTGYPAAAAGHGHLLVHDHPANVGLSSDDLRQLTKPGIAAIVAIGHDGSVFIASAGPRLDRDLFQDEQYVLAKAEVMKRLRAEWPSGQVTVSVSDAHFSHLVTLALQRAGIVQYWYKLRGTGRESFEKTRVVFARVVVGAAGQLGRKDRLRGERKIRVKDDSTRSR